MIHEYNLRVLPKIASSEQFLKEYLSKEKGLNLKDINAVRIVKRSIDARQRTVFVQLMVRVFVREQPDDALPFMPQYHDVSTQPAIIIVGAGPAGLFAALRSIELGMKPIVLERGKNVNDRKKDLALISREAKVNSESNYSFGEGGAGAYSDGKLYTRSKKKGNVDRILATFVLHGANPNILIDAHPHIGTDKLPNVIKNMRERILSCGGEVHFETRVNELLLKEGKVTGVVTATGQTYNGPVILATGHSARDVYRMLYQKKIAIEPKGIAVGVRLEHPQALIDQMQYHSKEGRGKYLPPAEYNFVTQVEGRGVYSFCMCPGGFVVPAASGPEQVVVNGMSPSNRGTKWANSGMVVEIRPEDVPVPEVPTTLSEDPAHATEALIAQDPAAASVFSIMRFQEEMERMAYINGGQTQVAPAQRMTDFVRGKVSFDLPSTSYAPGVISSPLHFLLPDGVALRLRKGFAQFGQWTRSFLTSEAMLIGVETRTSSPIRIMRNPETLQHVEIAGLYPCGEGAGYAGGIVSAAIDGERCAEQCAAAYL